MSEPRYQIQGEDGEQRLIDTAIGAVIFNDGSMKPEDVYLFRDLGDWVDRLNELAAKIAEQSADVKKLRALEVGGVDNWEGYENAMDLMRDGL